MSPSLDIADAAGGFDSDADARVGGPSMWSEESVSLGGGVGGTGEGFVLAGSVKGASASCWGANAGGDEASPTDCAGAGAGVGEDGREPELMVSEMLVCVARLRRALLQSDLGQI